MHADQGAIFGAVRIVAFALIGIGVAQCDRDAEPAVTDTPTPAIAAPNPSLDRADLLAALDRAASDFAAGQPIDGALTGRTVLLKLAFGCPGDSALAAPGAPTVKRSRSGADLEISLTPADWTRSPLVLSPGVEPTWERVDGISIARPWLREDGCPAQTTATPPAAPAGGGAGESAGAAEAPLPPVLLLPPPVTQTTAGLAVISGAETSRLGRRAGEAWRHTVRGQAGASAVAPPSGYRLVLGGRIGRFPDGRPVRCSSTSIDARPVCLAAVELDLVAFEDASGARLSEWRPT